MGQEMGWKSPVILASFLAFLAFTVAFLVQEKRCRDPVVDLTLLKKRDFTLAQGASFLQMMILAGALFLFPFYLELLKHIPVDRAGFILTAPSIAMVIFGPIAGMFPDKAGGRMVCTIAAVVSLAAFMLLSSFQD